MKVLDRFVVWYKTLPDKKAHVEFITALLSIPVLLTVIVLNVSNLNSREQEKNKQANQSVTVIPVEIKEKTQPTSSQSATPQVLKECKKEVGPINISSPEEGEKISKDPVNINIRYIVGEYCAVAWQYRINDAPWSDFTDKSIALYSLPPGNKKLELHIKSIASSDELTLTRNFIVLGNTPTPTQTASSSAIAN